MQNPEAVNRPPSRPPLSRPGSQESVRPPYIQRNDSVVGRPPSSPRSSASPIRPPSQTSVSSEDEITINEIKGNQSSMSRPSSGQKGPVQQNPMPLVGQSPIIQIASHPQNMQTPAQSLNQSLRLQQSTNPPNVTPQVQNQNIPQQNQAPISQMAAPHITQTQSVTPQTLTSAPTPSNKAQVTVPPNHGIPGPPITTTVQGLGPQNLLSHQSQSSLQQNLKTPQQPQQKQLSQNQTPQAQISTNNLVTPQGQIQPPTSAPAANQNFQQNSLQITPPNSGQQTPTQASPAPSSSQNSVPPSPIGPRKPTSARSVNPMPSPPKSPKPQKPEGITLMKEENKEPQELEFAKEINITKDNKLNQNDTSKEQKEKETPPKINGLQEKPLHKPPIIVDATLKRPMDLKGPSPNEKVEETDKTSKENEPPRPESSIKESTPTKAQETAVVNGNHESPKKSKAAPPKKLGTAQSPLKSPNKPPPKTPETPGSADKKKLPMNKIQVGAAPSPNLKSVRSKIGSLENAKHKPGGGHVKIEHRKLNFNVSPKIEAKNDTYTPGGGDKKIQQVKLQWNAKPKIGSLENAAHKPGGGDKKIESVKLDFKEKAKPKVGSKDNIKHTAGGGTVKNSEEHLEGNQCDIEDQKLEIKAQSKVGSLDNVKHKPGGGEKKIFDDKEYLKQMASTSTDSLNQERKKRSRCNSTSSQDSKYKSEEKNSSKLSLKSEGQRDSKEKSPLRPTDQNSNQVNDKNVLEMHLKNNKMEHNGDYEISTTQVKTNGINYQSAKKDANGNGKVQDLVKDEVTKNEMKQKAQIHEIKENQSSNNKTLDNKQHSIITLTPDDKKPPIKPLSQSPHIAETVQNKDLVPNNSSETSNTNQGKPGVPSSTPRPQVSPSNQTPQKSIAGLPANTHMARDLINNTYINEGNGIIEKSMIEKAEKETYRLDITNQQNKAK